MYVIDDTQSVFFEEATKALAGRGIECVPFSRFAASASNKNIGVYLAEATNEFDCTKDSEFVEFMKKNKFKRACFLKWNSPSLEIENYYNSAVKILSAPCERNFKTILSTFHLHRFFELVLEGEPNLPCAAENSHKLVNLIKKIAPSTATVLINGPTGTGKEVISGLIHNFSSRAKGAFVAINCAAIPDQMLESILFGHEKGAFTGAVQANQGIIRAAHGGTILLDEISEMPLTLQSKLLRVIQEKKVMPIGNATEIDVDVRILATTNRNMGIEIKAGRFREDLFYRLNVFPINNLSLTDRIDDIIPIVAHMLSKPFFENGETFSITEDALGALLNHKWPGNVRELDNLIQRAIILSTNMCITKSDLIFDVDETPGQLNTAEVLASKFKANETTEVL
jgi:two-component system response regulator FlrC